jgi:hypothetical protein
MADIPLSNLNELTTLSDTDLLAVSEDLGGGSYISRRMTALNALGVSPEDIVYVAKNGSDITGDGSFHKPYLTPTQALSSITDSSDSNRYTIKMAPGIYSVANPITMKAGVYIEGQINNNQVVLTAQTPSANFINLVNGSGVSNLELNGVTTGTGISMAVAGAVALKNLGFIDCQRCIHFNHASSAGLIDGISAEGSITIDDMVYIEATDQMSLLNVLPLKGTIFTNVLRSENATGVVVASGIISDSNDVVTCVSVSNGSDLTLKSSRITGDLGDRIGTAIKCTGTGSRIDVLSVYIQHADFGVYVDDTSSCYMTGVSMDLCDIGTYSHTNGSPRIEHNGGRVNDSLTWDIYLGSSSTTYIASGVAIDENLLFLDNATVSMCHVSDNPGDEGTGIKGELHVGYAERGSESVMGEGDSYVRGMIVLTTDSTASPSVDGGNLTDVSAIAKSPTGSTFSFQGVTNGYAILIGSSLANVSDTLKHWGIKVLQTTAANEVTPKSFIFEYWNGSAWIEFNVMATESNDFYRYADEVFIRASSSEHIRFGLTEDAIGSDWASKSINGDDLYWTRIRIETTVTTAPVFQQFKLSTNRFEANANGTNTYHGASRFRRTISSTGNVFGESGGVTDGDPDIGTGGIPNGWTHNIKNSKMNSVQDAIYFQTDIPKGTDTSLPLKINIKYLVVGAGASANGSIITSVLPMEAEGILEADPAGGILPVERTLANTEIITANQAIDITTSITLVDDTKIQNALFEDYFINDYYSGDLLAIRIEYEDDGDATPRKDIIIWGVEISVVNWTHGDTL